MTPLLWIIPAAISYLAIGLAFEALTDFGDGFEWKTLLFWPLFPVMVLWLYLADWFCEGRDWIKKYDR